MAGNEDTRHAHHPSQCASPEDAVIAQSAKILDHATAHLREWARENPLANAVPARFASLLDPNFEWRDAVLGHAIAHEEANKVSSIETPSDVVPVAEQVY